MSETVCRVRTGDRWLILDSLRGVSALVNDGAVRALTDEVTEASGELGELQSMLREAAPPPPRAHDGALSPLFLGLLPTRGCNMRCVYCGFGAASADEGPMPAELAIAAIEWMAAHQERIGADTLEVHFFGGEPLCEPRVVEVAVHHARMVAARRGLHTYFEVATNGLYEDAQARWVGDYFDAVVLSLDGPAEAHDLHRRMPGGAGSFETVFRTAKTLAASNTEFCVRACVSDRTLPELESTVAWFCDEFAPSTINIETVHPTPESEEACLLPPDPWEFAARYVRAARIARQAEVRIVYASAHADSPRVTFCPVGRDAVIVSPAGRISACYLPAERWCRRGIDLDLGSMTDAGTINLDLAAIRRVRDLVTDKPRCRECFCRWTCAGGCHVDETWPGSSTEYTDFCIQTRIISACLQLENLGFSHLVDDLLSDRGALEALALAGSDLLHERVSAGG